jgi:hypothetical protein
VRGSSSAVEYAKKSFSLDPVHQVSDFKQAATTKIPFLGGCWVHWSAVAVDGLSTQRDAHPICSVYCIPSAKQSRSRV